MRFTRDKTRLATTIHGSAKILLHERFKWKILEKGPQIRNIVALDYL